MSSGGLGNALYKFAQIVHQITVLYTVKKHENKKDLYLGNQKYIENMSTATI